MAAKTQGTPSFEAFYLAIKKNRWYWYFSIFCRVSLAFGFLMAGFVKIIDERFASGLSEVHPMGSYLVALHETGFYYQFIGYAQILAALLLLIPRTVALGALLYFPIILNIWILTLSVRFEGSFVTAPLMVFANLFLLVWHYDRLRYLLPLSSFSDLGLSQGPKTYTSRFPYVFFAGVLTVVVATVLIAQWGFSVMPRNSIQDCQNQFIPSKNSDAENAFCNCVHVQGKPLHECLELVKKLEK